MHETRNSGPLTLQEQLYRYLRGRIANGTYQPGDRLPSENQLIAEQHVSRVTVRAALAQLVDEGIVVKRQGKGTFVKPAFYHEDNTDTGSFSEACHQLGIEPSTKVISIARSEASDDVARLLADDGGTAHEIIELTRIRLADGIPCIIEIDYLPGSFDFLMGCDLSDASLIRLIRKHAGIAVARFDDYFYAVRASRQQSDLLDVASGTPLLKIDERCQDERGNIVYVNYQFIVTDRYVHSAKSAI